MRPATGGQSQTAAAENIDAVVRLEKRDEEMLAVHHRVFHWVGWFVGTIQFISVQCALVFCWIAFNLNFKQNAFDEYPFPLLATILALEAVLLTSCVLIRQSTIDRTLERRDHLELQISLLAEREATRSLRILQRIAKRLDVEDDEDCTPDELARETSVDEIARDLREREKTEKLNEEGDGSEAARST
ncbi:DUF1003 domain-containing protein [Bradyrhizobium sp. McL0615]|uniref:DUF1003 domain-containing protein n=1 Tax=Bradyrhizobium sp. McL0615 TaxID=3415673 RepID=UPI003CF9CAD3